MYKSFVHDNIINRCMNFPPSIVKAQKDKTKKRLIKRSLPSSYTDWYSMCMQMLDQVAGTWIEEVKSIYQVLQLIKRKGNRSNKNRRKISRITHFNVLFDSPQKGGVKITI